MPRRVTSGYIWAPCTWPALLRISGAPIAPVARAFRVRCTLKVMPWSRDQGLWCFPVTRGAVCGAVPQGQTPWVWWTSPTWASQLLRSIFHHFSLCFIFFQEPFDKPARLYRYFGDPLIIEGGVYTLCWCGAVARTWDIAPGQNYRIPNGITPPGCPPDRPDDGGFFLSPAGQMVIIGPEPVQWSQCFQHVQCRSASKDVSI